MKRKLILHIGFHKTGTSTIQNYLSSNYQLLKQNRILYPKRIRIERNNKLINGHHLMANCLGFGNRSKSVPNKLKQFYTELNDSDCHTCILSCEEFVVFKGIEQLESLKQAFKDFDIQIIAFVRRQDKYMESAVKQRLKRGGKLQIGEFAKMRLPKYLQKLEMYKAVFNDSKFKVISFDDLDKNIFKTFDEAIDLQNSIQLKQSVSSKNISLSNHQIDVINQLNEFTKNKYKRRILSYFNSHSKLMFEENNGTTFLGKKEYEIIFDACYSKNIKLKSNFKIANFDSFINWNLEESLKSIKKYNSVKLQEKALKRLSKKILND